MRKMKSIYGLVEIRSMAASAQMSAAARKGHGDKRTTAQLLAAVVPTVQVTSKTGPIGSY